MAWIRRIERVSDEARARDQPLPERSLGDRPRSIQHLLTMHGTKRHNVLRCKPTVPIQTIKFNAESLSVPKGDTVESAARDQGT
jgi:hypothetical protein